MKFSKMLLGLSLLGVLSGAAQAESINYYCKIKLIVSAPNEPELVVKRKLHLSELQLNAKQTVTEASNLSTSIANTILAKGFDLDVLFAGKQDQKQTLSSKLTLYLKGRKSLETVSSGGSQLTVVTKTGVFSSNDSVIVETASGEVTVAHDVSCTSQYRLFEKL